MKMEFLICKHCGNIVAMIRDRGVPVYCCGEKMQELIPGTTEASGEKHIPVYEVAGNTVHVTVGTVEHPKLCITAVAIWLSRWIATACLQGLWDLIAN